MKQAFPQLAPEHLEQPATYFISDLHLSDRSPEITTSFLAFLTAVAPHADAIYILGDFLDAWVGDDTPADFFSTIAAACRKAAEQTKLYFLQGNRDFLFSDKLLAECDIQRLTDPSVITLYDERIAVCHGDHLCGRDFMHLFFRSIAQSRFFRWLFLSFSLQSRLKIAGQLRSEKHRQFLHPPLVKFDVTDGRVKKLFKKNRTKTVIHGHTHRPCHHKLLLRSGNNVSRWVLGAWGRCGVILRCDAQQKQLLKWDPICHQVPDIVD
jgi:UDP-2,3-diacylglucosamine hydrolase